MSANNDSSMTSFRWKLANLRKQREDLNANPNGLTSGNFSLKTRSSIQFALFVSPLNRGSLFDKNAVSVVLKQFDGKSFEASVKLWIESTEGRKFGKTFVKKHKFGRIGDHFGYYGLISKDYTDFYGLYHKNETIFICCEIVDLDVPKLQVINCDQAFRQNQWALYENEKFFDAIVKVGNKEFKVLKFILAAQSKVFESMFESTFKEGITNTIEAKDVDEDTVKHLIKWFYTSKLEKDAPIEKLFYVAEKYDIQLLKITCVKLMTNSLSIDNMFSRLVLSSTHSNNELKSEALEFINKMSKLDLADVLMSNEYHELKSKNQVVAKEVEELICNKLS